MPPDSPPRPTGWGGTPVEQPTLSQIEAAAERCRDVVVRTPLVPLHSYEANSALWLKPEILQPIRSYKLRGVFNWAAGLSDAERAKGFSTHSAGNTAQALGHVARLWGTAARSLLPDRTPPAKIEAIERYGVTPVVMPFDELLDYIFHARWEEEPYSFLNPWADPLMIAGNGALALEICQDLPTVRTVYVPVGGGGLIAGIGSALKAHRPHVRVIAVQPEACPALQVSLAAGRPAWIEPQPTVCDTALPLVVDELFPLLSQVVEGSGPAGRTQQAGSRSGGRHVGGRCSATARGACGHCGLHLERREHHAQPAARMDRRTGVRLRRPMRRTACPVPCSGSRCGRDARRARQTSRTMTWWGSTICSRFSARGAHAQVVLPTSRERAK
jgi:threonine dehydratase